MLNVREALINAGVKNLKEYGYPDVNSDNILTDEVFSAFFLEMLNDNLGQGYDREINALIVEVSPKEN